MKRPKLEELTLTEKISQLLMVRQSVTAFKLAEGCADKFIRRTDEEIAEIMGKYQYGGIWHAGMHLFNAISMEEGTDKKATTADSKALVEAVSAAVRLPVLVGVDCEKGTGGDFSDGTYCCSALAIGAADDEELTFQLNAAIAREIKAAGGNWRWMPVVDLMNRYCAGFGRTFSDDIDKIIKHARAAIKGTESQKVASTVKHFPGYDPYEIRDSHIVTTAIDLSMEEWWETQAKTFQGVIDAGVDSVMIGHTAFPAADDTMVNGQYLPATMSSKIIQGLLREQMGFDGVVITDGMQMSGLNAICPYDEVLVRCINAGNDMLLGVNPYDFEIVEKAVLDGRIPMERINESAERILKLKEKIGLFDDAPAEEIDMQVQAPLTAEIDRKIAEKSITLLYDRKQLLPLSKDKIRKVAIVCSSHAADTVKRLEVMKAAFEQRGATVTITEELYNRQNVEDLVAENDLIVYAAYVAMHTPVGMPSLYGDKMKHYFHAFTRGKEKSIGVSLGYPFAHIDFMAGADTFFNIYYPNPESLKALVKVLYGELPPCTVSPVDVEPKRRIVYG